MKSKVMTAILTCLIICLTIISFASCSAKDYKVIYLTDTGVNVETEDITLITSQEELNDYMNSSRFLEAANNVVEKMESYSSDFFDNKMLVVINLQESSSSSKITVEKIDFVNSEAVITLKRKVPTVADDSIRVWSIFVEVDIQEIESIKYTFQ